MRPPERGGPPPGEGAGGSSESPHRSRHVRLPGGGEYPLIPGDPEFAWAVRMSARSHPGSAPGTHLPEQSIDIAKRGLRELWSGVSWPEAVVLWQIGKFEQLWARHAAAIQEARR